MDNITLLVGRWNRVVIYRGSGVIGNVDTLALALAIHPNAKVRHAPVRQHPTPRLTRNERLQGLADRGYDTLEEMRGEK